jgi:hypothetical protein
MISREELYELVWAQPMIKAAKQFDVSGSYLARICGLLNVPRPERGYWAKLTVGKAPARPILPPARPGDELYWSKEGDQSLKPRPAAQPARPAPPSVDKPRPVRVPKDHIHGLIRGAKELFIATYPIEEGTYLKPYKKLLVDVTASKACLDKALDFANELFNALEASGRRVTLSPTHEGLRRSDFDEREEHPKGRNPRYRSLWSPSRPTVTYIGDIAIGLSIVEMSEQVVMRYVNGKYIRDADYVPPKSRRYADHTWTKTEALPSGRLRLIAYSPYGRVHWSAEWQETTKTGLERQLKTIITAIESAAVDMVGRLEAARLQAEIEHKAHLAAMEKWRRDDDRREVAKSHKDSETQLRQIIQDWGEVIGVERFLAGVQERASVLPEQDRDRVLDRLKLARDFLGSQDPLDFFRSWKTPEERYKSLYKEDVPVDPPAE